MSKKKVSMSVVIKCQEKRTHFRWDIYRECMGQYGVSETQHNVGEVGRIVDAISALSPTDVTQSQIHDALAVHIGCFDEISSLKSELKGAKHKVAQLERDAEMVAGYHADAIIDERSKFDQMKDDWNKVMDENVKITGHARLLLSMFEQMETIALTKYSQTWRRNQVNKLVFTNKVCKTWRRKIAAILGVIVAEEKKK